MPNDRNTVRSRLAARPQLCPSLLNCDFGRLADEIADAERSGAIAVHWDVMDGHFVPNLTYGPPVIASLRPATSLLFDAHLMMSDPGKHLDAFLDAGCDIVTIHLEAVPDPSELLQAIRRRGRLAGLSINPPTPVEALRPWLDRVDLVLIMSVMPGFGGQAFDQSALPKLEWVKRNMHPDTLLEVDGGVNAGTIAAAAKAGAHLFVVGSAFYHAPNRQAQFATLTQLVNAQLSRS